MDYSLSNHDIDRLIPGSFMLYSDFDTVKNINRFMPVGTGKIILIRDSQNSGHYLVLFRYGTNKYFFVNSFGHGVDEQMKRYISPKKNDLYNGGADDLSRLLKMKHVSCLNLPLQDTASSVCGRYCLFFLKLFMNGDTLTDAVKSLKTYCKENGVSTDEAMLTLVQI